MRDLSPSSPRIYRSDVEVGSWELIGCSVFDDEIPPPPHRPRRHRAGRDRRVGVPAAAGGGRLCDRRARPARSDRGGRRPDQGPRSVRRLRAAAGPHAADRARARGSCRCRQDRARPVSAGRSGAAGRANSHRAAGPCPRRGSGNRSSQGRPRAHPRRAGVRADRAEAGAETGRRTRHRGARARGRRSARSTPSSGRCSPPTSPSARRNISSKSRGPACSRSAATALRP